MEEPAKEPDVDVVAVIHQLAEQADTAFAVLLSSHVEDWLQWALEANMRTLSNTLKERIFSGYGPLSSFSAKIDLAYALHIFEEPLWNDLRAIKDIRNEFAHSRTAIHFNSPDLAPMLRRLTEWSRDRDPKGLFSDRIDACINVCKAHLSHADLIKAIREYQSPRDASPDIPGLLSPPRDSTPDDSGAAE